jgi:hypothetical protein
LASFESAIWLKKLFAEAAALFSLVNVLHLFPPGRSGLGEQLLRSRRGGKSKICEGEEEDELKLLKGEEDGKKIKEEYGDIKPVRMAWFQTGATKVENTYLPGRKYLSTTPALRGEPAGRGTGQ